MTSDQAIYIVDHKIQMTQVLDYNHYSYRGVPCQIPCPVHKKGQEIKLSARLYTDNFIYCFTCGKQYTPSDIHAALRGLDKGEAAKELLTLFPITEEETKELIKGFYAPKRKTAPQALMDKARSYFIEYRHKVPLSKYKEWAIKLNALENVLATADTSDQVKKLHAFRAQMTKELGPYKQ